METAHSIAEVREAVGRARGAGLHVGFVPTMGALHEGHWSLVREARRRDGFVVVSVFVNPTQFGPGEDLERYPRTLEADREGCEREGADLLFAPEAGEMYPPGYATTVSVKGLTEGLCGRLRPGHFDGVTTVVAKLLGIVQPDRAYFGEKDYQQLAVIRRMVADLNLPVEVVGCPTSREEDGLARSSRNKYLSAEERAVAPLLYQALEAGAEVVRQGGSGAEAEQRAREALAGEPRFRVQYVQAVDPDTLEPHPQAGRPVVLAVAVKLGETRLIDNVIIN